jgi:hypothetical protein
MRTIVKSVVSHEMLLQNMESSVFYDQPIAYKAPNSCSICRLTRNSHGMWHFVMVTKTTGCEGWATKLCRNPHISIEGLMAADRPIHLFVDEEEFLKWALREVQHDTEMKRHAKAGPVQSAKAKHRLKRGDPADPTGEAGHYRKFT